MTVIIWVFFNCWALWQYAVSMIYGSGVWSMSSFQPAQYPRSAKCGWCSAKLHWICNQCWRSACTNIHTRTGFILPPVGTIVCIQSTSGLHHSQTTTSTTTPTQIYHETHTYTHISIALIFNTSSCAVLAEWSTEAQCCTYPPASRLHINPRCLNTVTYSTVTRSQNTSAQRSAGTHVKSVCMQACMQTLSTLIAGFMFYCKCYRAGGGQWSAENMRCVEMNTRSQWAPCFLGNVFSVAMQLKTSLRARAALFSACDAILQVCPAEGWVMGMHTCRRAQTQAHVHVHTEGDLNTRGLMCMCARMHKRIHII